MLGKRILGGLMALSFFACGAASDGDFNPNLTTNKIFTLQRVENCELLAKGFYEKEKNSIIAQLDQRLEDFTEYGVDYCGSYGYYNDAQPLGAPASDGDTASSSPAGQSPQASEENAQTTSTNIQELGVDESDLIKSDGQYVYYIAGRKLKITQVWPLESFQDLGSLDLNGTPRGLYLHGDQVIVIGDDQSGKTSVSYVSIEDKNHPKLDKRSLYTGRVLAERVIGSRMHLVLQSYLPSAYSYLDTNFLWDCDESQSRKQKIATAKSKIETLKKEKLAELAEKDYEQYFLSSTHEIAGQSLEENVSCQNYYLDNSDESSSRSIVALVTSDLNSTVVSDQYQVVYGDFGTVYSSQQNLFLAHGIYSEDEYKTNVHQFNLGKSPSYLASQQISGSLLNQFSMSEYKGVLRIALTEGNVSRNGNSGSESKVVTLDTEGGTLAQLGQVGGLGENETIYSVRFIGDKGYVVTFKKIDPLYVIDLSDAKSPKVMGELKIPGFSTYLHPMGSDHLIGFGKDADDQGGFAWFQGLKLSLFDVSDPTNPNENFQEIMGGRGSDSAALYDHHAFTFDAEKNLLILPVSLYEDLGEGSGFGNFLYSGVHIYRVTEAEGFELLRVIKTKTQNQSPYYYDYGDQVQRTILLSSGNEQGLVTLSQGELSLYSLDEAENRVGQVQWELTPYYYDYEL